MVAREATSSRRGSIWSTFGDDAQPGGTVLTDEEKAVEAKKAFVNSMKIIWDSGVNKIANDLWGSLTTGWKSGDIIGMSFLEEMA